MAFQPTDRALCYDACAILHSGKSKTAVSSSEKINRALIANADEKQTKKFFSDPQLRFGDVAGKVQVIDFWAFDFY